jgi:hypothetical protein
MYNDSPIEIEIKQETKDFWRFYLAYYLSFDRMFFFFLGFAVFGFFSTFLVLGKNIELLQLVDILVSAFLFTCLFGVIMSYFSVEGAKKLSLGKCKYVFSGESVELITKYFSSWIDWSYFQFVKENGDYFVLFMKDGNRTLIPKRFFQDYEQISDFKNLLRSKFGEKAQLRKPKEKLGLK